MTNDDLRFDLLRLVAHEMRTPLNAVQGFIELIELGGPLTERQKHFCDRALVGLDRMDHLISALLDMAQLEGDLNLNFVDCDLRPLIQTTIDLVENLAARRGVRIYVDVAPDVEWVSGDPQWLGQVISNLLSNAIKYNRDDGEVWITVVNDPDFISISVRDTGYGISPDEQERVFNWFFRSRTVDKSKIEGTGLGLAITKSIVQKHHGHIWLESIPDVGSTFTFTLPRRRRMTEGYQREIETAESTGEGDDGERISMPEISIEESDAIDDNLQEASGASEADSSDDVV
jgi:signal transduction histidine kinase